MPFIRLAISCRSMWNVVFHLSTSGFLDSGIKERKGLCVLRESYMPTALVELGVIDSEDVWLLKEHQEDMAGAVARGLTDYLQENLAFSGAKS